MLVNFHFDHFAFFLFSLVKLKVPWWVSQAFSG
jgi:hypothetical protein